MLLYININTYIIKNIIFVDYCLTYCKLMFQKSVIILLILFFNNLKKKKFISH